LLDVLYQYLLCHHATDRVHVSEFAKMITSAKEVMFLPVFVCLCVCVQDNSKSYRRIFLKF